MSGHLSLTVNKLLKSKSNLSFTHSSSLPSFLFRLLSSPIHKSMIFFGTANIVTLYTHYSNFHYTIILIFFFKFPSSYLHLICPLWWYRLSFPISPLLPPPPHPLPHSPLANFGHVTSHISTLLFLQPLASPKSLDHVSSGSVLVTRPWPLAGVGQSLRRTNHHQEFVSPAYFCVEF